MGSPRELQVAKALCLRNNAERPNELCATGAEPDGERAFRPQEGVVHWRRPRPDGPLRATGSGTLVLDEIGDIPLDLQTKLLRAIAENCFERIGSNESQPSRGREAAVRKVDREYIEDALKRHLGNQSAVAIELGIDRKTLAARWKAAQGDADV